MRKRHPIHIDFKVSSQLMQIRYDSENMPDYTTEVTKNGIIIFIFNILLVNKQKDKKNNKKITISWFSKNKVLKKY